MTAPIPTAPTFLYRDPAVFERERQSIFARSWQFLGLEADLRRRGEYVAEIIAGFPVVVVRDEAGALRGYHNVCRHRAGPLVSDTKGRCDKEFVCRFHKWRYGFDGALRAAVNFSATDSLDLASVSLLPIQVTAWRGLVFVNLDPTAGPLETLFGPVAARLPERASRSASVRHSHTVACNWKVYVETYLEGDHLEGVHADQGHHHEVFMDGEVALCGHTHAHHAPQDETAEENLWAWVWPNLGLTVYRDTLMIEHIRPDGPDRTIVDHTFLHSPEDLGVDAAMDASEDITDAHAWVCERVQNNLDAGVFTTGMLSPSREGAVAWFQAEVARRVSA